MPINVCKTAPQQRYACCRLLISFGLPIVLSFTPMQGFCVNPVKGSATFKYQETASILKKFQSKPYKLSKPERKVLRKELKFQTRKTQKGEGGNVGLQVFLLVLLTLAILWGSFLFIGLLSYAGGTPTFLLILLGLISIAGIVLLLIGGSKRIKRRKQLNAERIKNQSEPAPVL
jgi:hypothetical protein